MKPAGNLFLTTAVTLLMLLLLNCTPGDAYRLCSWTVADFQKSFFYQELSERLANYLNDLQRDGCVDELKRECDDRRFDTSAFTRHVYMSVCERQRFESTCLPKVRGADYGDDEPVSWASALTELEPPASVSEARMFEPCVQVAYYEAKPDQFVEMNRHGFLTCARLWSGFPIDYLKSHNVTIWTVADSR